MPVEKSKKLAILQRRQQVADLYVQGWTQTAIAERLCIVQSTVCADLQRIRNEWRASAVRDFDAAKDLELQKLDRIEREAWAAWERSQKPSQSAEIAGEGSVPSRKRIKNQHGDPRFLAIVNQCIANRMALLGLAGISPKEAATDGVSLEERQLSVVALVATLSERKGGGAAGAAPIDVQPGDIAQKVSQGAWMPARHLDYLNQALLEGIEQAADGTLDGLVVSMPPQHGKSELCSKYLPAWYLGTFPDRKVILVSYEADFAATWGRKARDLLVRWGWLFGVRVSRKSSAAARWELSGREGGMVTAGVGGPITGKGAHLLIVDDPIKNDEEARSATRRQKQWEWWQSVASTRLRPDALIIVIQTRWHRDDLTGRILEQAERKGQHWRSIRFPALAEEADELGRQPGEALWPEMYSAEKLEKVKASRTPYYWQGMYQQNPQAEGSSEWPAEYFGPEVWFDEWPREWACKVVALDPSKGTDAKHGDYSAFVKLMWSKENVLYVDADLGIWNIAVLGEMAVEMQREFQPHWFGVESNQFQQFLLHDVERLSEERRILMTPMGINNHVNKIVRIRTLTSLLAKRRIRFKAESQGTRLLVEQLRDFPNGDHDDGPDALEMAIRLAGELLQQAYADPGPTLVYA